MKSIIPLRVRIARYLSDRYHQREQPFYLWELIVFGILAIITIWPVLPLANRIMTLP